LHLVIDRVLVPVAVASALAEEHFTRADFLPPIIEAAALRCERLYKGHHDGKEKQGEKATTELVKMEKRLINALELRLRKNITRQFRKGKAVRRERHGVAPRAYL